jgi:hypothetical protein
VKIIFTDHNNLFDEGVSPIGDMSIIANWRWPCTKKLIVRKDYRASATQPQALDRGIERESRAHQAWVLRRFADF